MEKRTVLVVEDDFDTREMLQWLLEIEGFEVVTAENGAVALRKLAEDKPDLILTDLMMPMIAGEQLIQTLRRQAGLFELPIIVLTAFPGAFGELARTAGATEVLKKPQDLPKVAEIIKRYLDQTQA